MPEIVKFGISVGLFHSGGEFVPYQDGVRKIVPGGAGDLFQARLWFNQVRCDLDNARDERLWTNGEQLMRAGLIRSSFVYRPSSNLQNKLRINER